MQIDKTAILPQPDATALEYSHRLQNLIAQEIVHSGPISFARFMELALYAPGLGYYSAGSRKFGKEGDFITSPEMSSLFSKSLAKQCAQVLNSVGGDILEFGAGSGKMAAGILAELECLAALPNHYYILEISADLRERQQQYLKNNLPELVERVIWLDQLPESFSGMCLANEVLDAFPVHRFKKIEHGFQELYVEYKNNQFGLIHQRPCPALEHYLCDLPELPADYQSECNLNIQGWINSISKIMCEGTLLIIDYGYPRAEYYHPERSQGTFMCHYRHHAHTQPLANIGLQDLTAHVDFTAVITAAHQAGFSLAGYTNQANFLLSCGMIDYLHEVTCQEQYLRLSLEAKVLTAPSEMGELFKVMALNKNHDGALLGFMLRDYSERL